MISGTVNADREAVIALKVRGTGATEQNVNPVIDTGFPGFLTLPSSLITALNLPFVSRQQVTLGDGKTYPVNVYAGVVEWDGQLRRVEVDEADTTPLVGMWV